MKALLLSAYNQLELQDLPSPIPGPDELLIQVSACGICGSDVHGYDGSTGRRIPPIVMGHEASGVVTSVGSDVRDFAPGDRVTFDSTVYCGECVYCLRGEVNLCDNRQVVGVSTPDFRRAGAFAEYVTVPERIVYRLPDDLSFVEAAMLEAVAVAVHAVAVTNLAGGETVLVIGAGMIGLLIVQALKAAGSERVLVADVDASRLKVAQEAGADATILASGDAIEREVLRLTDGFGADAVLEAVGRDETVSAAVNAVRKGGTVTLVGNITPTVTLPLQKVVSRQIRLQGSCASSGEYPASIGLVSAGKIKVKPLITSIAPLEEGAQWFERLHAREPNLMKIVLDPRLTSEGIPGGIH
jgi:L-iditol 2-dehydrogenase